MIITLIIIAALILHFFIGSVTAIKMAPKIAELCTRITEEESEYEWRNNFGQRRWVDKGWEPKAGKGEEWKKTGNTKGGITTEFVKYKFSERMTLIRLLWFVGVPVVNAQAADNQIISKFNPEIAELKNKKLQADIDALHKELEMKSDD